ncbi:hypothetical protein POTOM_009180 [Populus tomentosa]|uniref:Protein kinase domain-containing protein n=1 Tax=Populus tomentosa TaxID=118781 RepID=A0A8X8A7Y9_POPTO|nr:hypothetical protein POTOM_009180 [Populus tomentosa]
MPPFPPPPRSWFPSTAPVIPVNITSTTATTHSSTDTKLNHLPVLDIPAHLCFSESDRGTHSPDTPEGNTAAVKVMKGDVSNEIDILKMINNSNVIRLSGFCAHEGNTHLVYHFTENGSLADWLLSNNKYRSLAWMQIIQIAYDVADALNYLLNYTNPLYIHKNLKTSNILLDANLRAKLADFGLAITLENDQDGGFQSTRHDSGYSKLYGPLNTYKMESAPRLDVVASGVVMLELLSGKEAAAAAIEKSSGDELLSVKMVRVLEVDNVRETLWLPIPLGSSLPNGPAG